MNCQTPYQYVGLHQSAVSADRRISDGHDRAMEQQSNQPDKANVGNGHSRVMCGNGLLQFVALMFSHA